MSTFKKEKEHTEVGKRSRVWCFRSQEKKENSKLSHIHKKALFSDESLILGYRHHFATTMN